jgi:hypothetical protein
MFLIEHHLNYARQHGDNMSYLVSLQEVGMPWGFTQSFSGADRDMILNATTGMQFKLTKGSAQIYADGDLLLTLRSPGGFSHHCVNYAEICRQLRNPESVTLYDHRNK